MSMHPIRVGDWPGVEQRKHRRVALGVPVECQSSSVSLQGKAENISFNGLLVRTSETFAEDEEVTMSFSLPGSGSAIQCRARVAHVVPDTFMGIEFLDLSPESSKLIEEYITTTSSKLEKR